MDIWKDIEQIDNMIYSESKKITNDNGEEILKKVYCYVKSKLNDFYNGSYMHPGYNIIRDDIITLEKQIQGKILNTNKLFDIESKSDNFIEYLVHKTWLYLIERYYPYYLKKQNVPINELNFTNYCQESALYIKKICDKEKIICYVIPIYPGYTNKINLYNGTGYHFINIIYYNNDYYLIDTTYSQFFYKNTNNLERIGLVNIAGCKPGRYMIQNLDTKKIAIELLEKGYIKLNEEIFKKYLDAFTVSFRNGLYYENTNDFTFTTNYNIDNYINFLKGNDNQVYHEGIDNLGYQKKPMQKDLFMKKY